MAVYKQKIQIKSHGGTPTFVNITDEVRKAIADSGILKSMCMMNCPTEQSICRGI